MVMQKIIFEHKAWLHRRDGYCWEFTANEQTSGLLCHKTRYGTVYAIFEDVGIGKPFWVGRLHDKSWLTWEGRLGARRIEFENGGKYVFPA